MTRTVVLIIIFITASQYNFYRYFFHIFRRPSPFRSPKKKPSRLREGLGGQSAPRKKLQPEQNQGRNIIK